MSNVNFSAQGHITVHRLRTGDVISLTMASNAIALYQAYDEATFDVNPNWSTDGISDPTAIAAIQAVQPWRRPVLTSAKGSTVTLDDGRWYYNDELLTWGNTDYVVSGESKTYKVNTNASCAGKFALIASTMEIRIIGNLPSAANTWNDQLTFKCNAIAENVSYSEVNTMTIELVGSGASSYRGTVVAASQVLDSSAAGCHTTLTAQLHLGLTDVQTFYVKIMGETGFLHDGAVSTASNGVATFEVYGSGNNSVPNSSTPYDDVSGMALLTAYFYTDSNCNNLVAKAGVELKDQVDEYDVVLTEGNVSEVAEGQSVTVTAGIINMKTGVMQNISGCNPIYDLRVLDPRNITNTPIKTSNTNTIVVTTSETDLGGQLYDVEVTADVKWTGVPTPIS